MNERLTFPSESAAFAFFDRLQPVPTGELVGVWLGRGVTTGHPLDGVLENLGWYGKRFRADGRADALLFRVGDNRLLPIDPALIPLGLALRFHRFARTEAARNLFSHLALHLRAKGPVASLRSMPFRGAMSAAMVYDRKPIIDHFRKIDRDRVLGVMQIEGGDRHYFFELERVTDGTAEAR
ncbi:DUF4334 domain-containing protein [Sinorhizobium alkalisoli]|uniref:Uncharacterized protein n=1 Tax=Sinorhizobium alkalisoli TaxID=1752398 RepID=A0A1E3V5F0_9HYPH|nr:DUF4334 domain-containing protein [Sinorhizobium alkalisoli]MCA1494667.1 DUF4334 domain-containing protein [Ensifer sp. NBAIM29]MCG5481803.1 DUF4334 domain-containing protein [Sinorhizobium alkalisoli]ODR88371.1 hypothetical protein A8M32_25535 [Sinorhizobium alkalisoli]QFI69645.1 hypothetical protein EKH55_4771 [Sinorhizobium alkalisoli]